LKKLSSLDERFLSMNMKLMLGKEQWKPMNLKNKILATRVNEVEKQSNIK